MSEPMAWARQEMIAKNNSSRKKILLLIIGFPNTC